MTFLCSKFLKNASKICKKQSFFTLPKNCVLSINVLHNTEKRRFRKALNDFPRPVESIITIDGFYCGIEHNASSHLILDDNGVIIIDPNTNKSIPGIIAELENQNLTSEDITTIIITHIHLDHAGGCSELIKSHCPNAKIYAHPKSAKHLENPEGIIKGATQVYGDNFSKFFGHISEIPNSNIIPVDDYETITIGSRKLKFLHTLGHATHHMCIHDLTSNSIFTGDSFGMCYDPYDKNYIIPTTTPIDFDPDEMTKSIFRIVDTKADRAYFTHFGVLEDIEEGAIMNLIGLNMIVEILQMIPEWFHECGNKDVVMEMVMKEMENVMTEITGKSKEDVRNDKKLMNDVYLNSWGCLVNYERFMKDK